jgi:hypothetical protein
MHPLFMSHEDVCVELKCRPKDWMILKFPSYPCMAVSCRVIPKHMDDLRRELFKRVTKITDIRSWKEWNLIPAAAPDVRTPSRSRNASQFFIRRHRYTNFLYISDWLPRYWISSDSRSAKLKPEMQAVLRNSQVGSNLKVIVDVKGLHMDEYFD